jgi:2-polyprenyl-3-methyl-5-hydroxy-6-metoxy-1,4-benzoquinol methylase
MNKQKLLSLIEQTERHLDNMRALIQTPRKSGGKQKFALGTTNDFTEVPNYNDPKWPVAAPAHLIVPSNADTKRKLMRGMQLAAQIKVPYDDKSILEIGCGDGATASALAKRSKRVVGYDVVANADWPQAQTQNIQLTDSRDLVVAGGPYDFIVMLDVIDHCSDDPVDLLKWAADLLADNGQMFVKVHPWTARHGGHFYEQLNKAYVHLALTPEEAIAAGVTATQTQRFTRPQAAYQSLFENAGLHVKQKQVHTEPVDAYISGQLLDRMIQLTWGGSIDQPTALKIMGIQYIDYVLGK